MSGSMIPCSLMLSASAARLSSHLILRNRPSGTLISLISTSRTTRLISLIFPQNILYFPSLFFSDLFPFCFGDCIISHRKQNTCRTRRRSFGYVSGKTEKIPRIGLMKGIFNYVGRGMRYDDWLGYFSCCFVISAYLRGYFLGVSAVFS